MSRFDADTSFEKLFKGYYQKVKKFAVVFLKDDVEADEVAQKVFIKLWKHRRELYKIVNLDSYIMTVSKNALLDEVKKRKGLDLKLEALEFLQKGIMVEDLNESLATKEYNNSIRIAVDNMPEKRREVFILSRYHNLSNDEIAQKTGLSKRTVEKHIQLALGDLKKTVNFS